VRCRCRLRRRGKFPDKSDDLDDHHDPNHPDDTDHTNDTTDADHDHRVVDQ